MRISDWSSDVCSSDLHAVFDGWTSAALVSAARETRPDSQMLELAFPGGATDMINAWFESLDEALTQAIPAQTLSEIKMRDRDRQSAVLGKECVSRCRYRWSSGNTKKKKHRQDRTS